MVFVKPFPTTFSHGTSLGSSTPIAQHVAQYRPTDNAFKIEIHSQIFNVYNAS